MLMVCGFWLLISFTFDIWLNYCVGCVCLVDLLVHISLRFCSCMFTGYVVICVLVCVCCLVVVA